MNNSTYPHILSRVKNHWHNFGKWLVAQNGRVGIKSKTAGKAVIEFMEKTEHEQAHLIEEAEKCGLFETEV